MGELDLAGLAELRVLCSMALTPDTRASLTWGGAANTRSRGLRVGVVSPRLLPPKFMVFWRKEKRQGEGKDLMGALGHVDSP